MIRIVAPHFCAGVWLSWRGAPFGHGSIRVVALAGNGRKFENNRPDKR